MKHKRLDIDCPMVLALTRDGAPVALLATRSKPMRIATISKQGLLTLAILVAVLWGCWIAQRQYLSQARQNVEGATQNIWRLHRKALPSVSPGRPLTRRTTVI